MTAKYQCFYLDPQYKLCHFEDSEPLLETDSFAEAATFVWKLFEKEGKDVCVYHPESNGYQEYYRKPLRDKKGRFI